MIKVLLLAPVASVLILIVAAEDAAAESSGFIDWLIPLSIIAVLILLNGIYVAAEFAIIGTRPTQLEELALQGNGTAKRVLKILDSPPKQDRYIATAQLGITIASLGLGMYAEPAIAHLIEPYITAWFGAVDASTLHSITYVLVLGVLTYLHVVVGEMVPKSIALSSAVRSVLWLNNFMRLSQIVLSPFVYILNKIGAGLMSLLRLPPPTARVHSPEEIEQIVSESAEGGLLNEEEQEIIRNIFDFGDRQVGQIMTPRRKVQAIPSDIGLEEVLQIVTHSRHNRFPVYQDNRDQVIGILHMRDLIEYKLHSNGTFDIAKLVSAAPAVPEDKPVEELLAVFKRDRIHMAIVLDEFGGMAGVVTLEDLVEEVVGEVRDEFDVEKEPFVAVEPGVLELAGNFLVDDLKEHVDLGPPESLPQVDTVGGLVITKLGRPPEIGDECVYGHNTRFVVTDVDGLAVARVRVEFPTLQAEASREEE